MHGLKHLMPAFCLEVKTTYNQEQHDYECQTRKFLLACAVNAQNTQHLHETKVKKKKSYLNLQTIEVGPLNILEFYILTFKDIIMR